ncbi:alpha/beta fold hydrolase [Caulobacter sp. NIBR2454]|uniref:alpha/beta fold hydrolase n=1 Tax=Caulobacter sp. NIBR2454 TaxID=3015996 RepID=UPI0022B69EE1|nr:alpha/beta hydrolase [Caulobacter sp. NIBR2454]
MAQTAASETEFQRRTITVAGGAMAALEFGPADRPIDVVFLNANGFNAMTYRSILGPLKTLRILAVDQRGHGHTNLPLKQTPRASWNDLRDDLLALLETLDGPPPVLAGHSMGGTASLLAAAKHPGVARGLVLFDPVVTPRAAWWAAQLPGAAAAALKGFPLAVATVRRRDRFPDRETAFAGYHGRGAFKTWSDQMLRDYLEDGLIPTGEGDLKLACKPAWEASNYAAQGHNSWGALRRIGVPTRILRAERNSTCSLVETSPLLARKPNISLSTIAGTSHFIAMERPELVREALLAATA